MTTRAEWSRLVLSYCRNPDHRDAWQWLLDREHVYPTDQNVAPWKRTQRRDHPRAVAMVAVGVRMVPRDGSTVPTWVATYDADGFRVVPTDGTAEQAGLLASQWFTPKRSRTVHVVPLGGSHYLHTLLTYFVPHWVQLGYRVQPVVSRSVLIVLRVTKGKHAWTFADWQAMTQTEPPVFSGEQLGTPGGVEALNGELATRYREVCALQAWVQQTFQVDIRPTVGGTALAAAARFLPADEKLFRPHPLLLAMCRDGGAYRGGYVYGQRYRGPGYKADVRRLYTAMIAESLPSTWSFGLGYDQSGPVDGIFVCTLSGEPRIPVYLAVWDGPERGFYKRHWYGGTAIAIVPSTEYDGLRALGIRVEPGSGFRAVRTFTLAEYVNHLQTLIRDAGPSSPIGEYCKGLGNTVTGKWAQSPHLDGLVYSDGKPTDDAEPAFSIDGDRLDRCWHVPSTRYLGSQQVGLAAWVTARARSCLYGELARAMDAGRTVVHAHTDGYIATGPAPDWLPSDTDTIGAWRLVDTDSDVITIRGGMYVVGSDAKTSGAPGGTRRMVEIALDAGGYVVGGVRLRDRRELA